MTSAAPRTPTATKEERTVAPMPFSAALAWFGLPAAVFFMSVHLGIPALERLDLGAFAAYLVALLVPLVTMTLASLLLLRAEGYRIARESLRTRYRFRAMRAADWWWSLGAIMVGLVGLGALGAAGAWLVASGSMPLPERLPTALDPRFGGGLDAILASVRGGLAGRWDLLALYFAVLAFNVAGEELFWRGYILPRQEAAHGRRAWAIHGTMWAAFHIFKWWEVLALLPVTLSLSYVCQRRRNSTPGVVIHLAVNGLGFVGFAAIVAGLV